MISKPPMWVLGKYMNITKVMLHKFTNTWQFLVVTYLSSRSNISKPMYVSSLELFSKHFSTWILLVACSLLLYLAGLAPVFFIPISQGFSIPTSKPRTHPSMCMGQGRSKRIEESKGHIPPCGWDRGVKENQREWRTHPSMWVGQGRSKRIKESKGHIPPCGWDRGGQRESKRVKDTSLHVGGTGEVKENQREWRTHPSRWMGEGGQRESKRVKDTSI